MSNRRDERLPAEAPNRRRRDSNPGWNPRGGEDSSRGQNRAREEAEYGGRYLPGAKPGNDEILRTDRRPHERAKDARPDTEPPAVKDAPPFGRPLDEGEGAPSGWLPSSASVTPEEVFVCAMVALAAFVVLGGAIVLAAGLLPMSEGVAQDPVPAALFGGASVGFYVLLKRRGMRLDRRKHLRGEK